MKGSGIVLLLVVVAALFLLIQKPDIQAQLDNGPGQVGDAELLARVASLEAAVANQGQSNEWRDLQRRVAAIEQKLDKTMGNTRSSSASSQLDVSRRDRTVGEVQRSMGSLELKLSTVQREITPLKQELSSLKQTVRQLETTVARIDYRR
ncbi:MAG: hypothetical protein ACR2NZ_16310 [Rubripirellula sp.]